MQIKNLIPTLLLLFFSAALFTTACKKDDENECVTTDMSYKDDIVPILEDNGCLASNCHDGTNVTGGAFDYTAYSNVKLAVDAERLLGAIKRETGFSPMPKGGDKLSDCDISKVESWITDGALDN